MSPNISYKTDGTGGSPLKRGDQRNADPSGSIIRDITAIENRKEYDVDSNQNDHANNHYHLFRKHVSTELQLA
jgi:hypothetical protein